VSAAGGATPVRLGIRSGLWLPLFGELAEQRAVMQVAAEAEEAGWHGVFAWDQLCWRAPVMHVGDPGSRSLPSPPPPSACGSGR